MVVALDRSWSVLNTPAGLSMVMRLLVFMMYLKVREFASEMNDV